MTFDEVTTFGLVARSGTHDVEMAREIFEDRYYDGEGWDLPDGAVVLDLGGGIGAFVVHALRQGARVVHTYEPMPESMALLVRNTNAALDSLGCGRLHRYQVAVAVEAGAVRMSGYDVMDDGMINTGRPAITDHADGLEVEAVSIHDVLALEDHWDVVKLDIEGYEYALLDALTDDEWVKIDMITMEFHHDDEATCQARGLRLGQQIRRHGFATVDVDWSWGCQGRLRARR